MSNADRLRMMIHNGYMQAIREDDGDIEAHICRAIKEEFKPGWDSTPAIRRSQSLIQAIREVAEADDDQ